MVIMYPLCTTTPLRGARQRVPSDGWFGCLWFLQKCPHSNTEAKQGEDSYYLNGRALSSHSRYYPDCRSHRQRSNCPSRSVLILHSLRRKHRQRTQGKTGQDQNGSYYLVLIHSLSCRTSRFRGPDTLWRVPWNRLFTSLWSSVINGFCDFSSAYKIVAAEYVHICDFAEGIGGSSAAEGE